MNSRQKLSGITRSHTLVMWFFLFLLLPQLGWAVGTPAGTTISNTVTLSYDITGISQPDITSTPATFKTDELIKPTLTWEDGTAVSVSTPGSNDALTFKLTNSGNGQETFGLTRTNGPLPLPLGNYTPLNGSVGSIYLENGLQAGFQAAGPNTDTAYTPGTNDPNLAPDAQQIIYVISDTPSVPANSQGEVQLTATSLTAGAASAATPGASTAGLVGCTANCSAVFATAYGQDSLKGSYIASGLALTVNKTVASVVDANGLATALMPGAVINYQIEVTLSGSGTATNLVITDPMPADTTYKSESIEVTCISGTYTGGGACGTGTITPQPAVAKTDSNLDADFADFTANTVSVSLGNVAAPASFVITFSATIN